MGPRRCDWKGIEFLAWGINFSRNLDDAPLMCICWERWNAMWAMAYYPEHNESHWIRRCLHTEGISFDIHFYVIGFHFHLDFIPNLLVPPPYLRKNATFNFTKHASVANIPSYQGNTPSDTYGVIPTHHLNNFLWQRDEFPLVHSPVHHEFSASPMREWNQTIHHPLRNQPPGTVFFRHTTMGVFDGKRLRWKMRLPPHTPTHHENYCHSDGTGGWMSETYKSK